MSMQLAQYGYLDQISLNRLLGCLLLLSRIIFTQLGEGDKASSKEGNSAHLHVLWKVSQGLSRLPKHKGQICQRPLHSKG